MKIVVKTAKPLNSLSWYTWRNGNTYPVIMEDDDNYYVSVNDCPYGGRNHFIPKTECEIIE